VSGIELELQIATDQVGLPAKQQIEKWIQATINRIGQRDTGLTEPAVTVRLVGVDEIHDLNRTYRNHDKPTNVLSFPFERIEGIEESFLGDLVICAEIVTAEAVSHSKSESAHWAHMVVHGTLHLCGYNHVENKEAEVMEALEVTILDELGFRNPYVLD